VFVPDPQARRKEAKIRTTINPSLPCLRPSRQHCAAVGSFHQQLAISGFDGSSWSGLHVVGSLGESDHPSPLRQVIRYTSSNRVDQNLSPTTSLPKFKSFASCQVILSALARCGLIPPLPSLHLCFDIDELGRLESWPSHELSSSGLGRFERGIARCRAGETRRPRSSRVWSTRQNLVCNFFSCSLAG